MELCIQLAIIFVGKQLLQNNIMEIFLPRLKRWIKEKCCGGDEKIDKSKLKPWEKDINLDELGPQGLFFEYLEILIQFGFVTLFVAAFPLAPFCALLNNIIEIRADADKFVTQYRRPMAHRAQKIGIWYEVCYVVSRLAILSNAFLITSTSSFIERVVYRMEYSEAGGLDGFVNSSLAYFNVSDFEHFEVPDDPNGDYANITLCRYKGYNEPPWADDPYAYTTQYWHIMAAQFIFVVVFENVIIVLTSLLAYMIPDMPRKLMEQVHREAYLTNEIILKTELEIAKGEQPELPDSTLMSIRRRVRAAFGLEAKKSSTESIDKNTADSAV